MKVKNKTGQYFGGLVVKKFFYLSLTINLLVVVLYLLSSQYLPPVIPLLYGRPVGEGQLVPKIGFLLAPSVSLTITLINAFLSTLFKDLFVKKTLIIGAFMLTFLTTITTIKIFFLVALF